MFCHSFENFRQQKYVYDNTSNSNKTLLKRKVSKPQQYVQNIVVIITDDNKYFNGTCLHLSLAMLQFDNDIFFRLVTISIIRRSPRGALTICGSNISW